MHRRRLGELITNIVIIIVVVVVAVIICFIAARAHSCPNNYSAELRRGPNELARGGGARGPNELARGGGAK